jgi:hypothetical protein
MLGNVRCAVGRMALEQIVFEFRFPLPVLILTGPHSYSTTTTIIIIRTGTVGPIVADIPTGLRKKKKKAGTVFFDMAGIWKFPFSVS